MPHPLSALFSRRSAAPRIARLAVALALALLACGCPELDVLRQQNANLRSENEQWRRRWESTDASRKEAVAALQDQQRDLQGEIERLGGNIEERERIVLSSERELSAQLHAARDESSRLAEELKAANARGDDLGKRLLAANDATAASEAKRAGEAKALGLEIEKLRLEAAALAREVAALKEESRKSGERADAAEKERDKWQTEAKAAQAAATSALADAAQAANAAKTPGPPAPGFPRAEAEAAIAKLREAIGPDAAKALALEWRAGDDGAALILPSDALFDKEAVALSSKAIKPLAAIGKELAKLAGRWRFAVAGHADNVPIKSLPFYNNRELSFSRAFAVTRLLAEDGGVAESSLETRAYGEHAPRANNRDAKGRAANRRVEIILLPRESAGR
jgi:flagellar motor protein MotB